MSDSTVSVAPTNDGERPTTRVSTVAPSGPGAALDDGVEAQEEDAEGGDLQELDRLVVQPEHGVDGGDDDGPAPRVGVGAEGAPPRVLDREAVVGDHLADVAQGQPLGLAHVEGEVVAPIDARQVVGHGHEADQHHHHDRRQVPPQGLAVGAEPEEELASLRRDEGGRLAGPIVVGDGGRFDRAGGGPAGAAVRGGPMKPRRRRKDVTAEKSATSRSRWLSTTRRSGPTRRSPPASGTTVPATAVPPTAVPRPPHGCRPAPSTVACSSTPVSSRVRCRPPPARSSTAGPSESTRTVRVHRRSVRPPPARPCPPAVLDHRRPAEVHRRPSTAESRILAPDRRTACPSECTAMSAAAAPSTVRSSVEGGAAGDGMRAPSWSISVLYIPGVVGSSAAGTEWPGGEVAVGPPSSSVWATSHSGPRSAADARHPRGPAPRAPR